MCFYLYSYRSIHCAHLTASKIAWLHVLKKRSGPAIQMDGETAVTFTIFCVFPLYCLQSMLTAPGLIAFYWRGFLMAACAAASLAIGTRNGEQLT